MHIPVFGPMKGIIVIIIMIEAISLAKCFEFSMLCDVLPTIGARMSTSDLGTLIH